MTKKDYQAIAGAFWRARPISAERTSLASDWQRAIDTVAGVLAADNPRFDRECFMAACEDGNVGRRPKRRRERFVECDSCGEMRPEGSSDCRNESGRHMSDPASEPCDTSEEA